VATKTLSRRALRQQNDHVEQTEQADLEDDGEESPGEAPKAKKPRARKPAAAKPPKVKAPTKPRVRKKTAKVPPRMFARWAVCDGGLKRLAVFEYRDLAAAEERLADLRERKSGIFVLQLVKDPYTPPEPEPAAAV
jgi:hypothetical protein